MDSFDQLINCAALEFIFQVIRGLDGAVRIILYVRVIGTSFCACNI